MKLSKSDKELVLGFVIGMSLLLMVTIFTHERLVWEARYLIQSLGY